MRSSATSNVVLVTLVAGMAALYGCSSDTGGGTPTFPGGTAGNPGTAGTPGASGSTGTAGTPGASGSTSTAGNSAGGAGTAGSGGAGMTTAGAGGMSMGGGDMGGAGGGGNMNVITKVWKSDGCMKAPTDPDRMKVNIPTSGDKDAACADKLADGTPRCGAWGKAGSTWLTDPLPREFQLYLPQGYDNTKAYPLVFEGPGCGGNAGGVYGLAGIANNAIRVGLTPPDPKIGHGTNPGQRCFDDKEGDDSVDWVFYENLYDRLNAELCFDRNRVFSVGDSSGSWFSNEVGCKYAGDAKRPIRGVLPNTGGLPNQPQFEPTCTNSPMAGIWVHEVNDPENPFAGNKFAISRAMTVNKCQGATDYDDAVAKGMVENFPIGGGKADDTCKKIKGCPEIYPLVVCALPGNQHAPHGDVVEPAFPTFLKLFSQGNFLTQ